MSLKLTPLKQHIATREKWEGDEGSPNMILVFKEPDATLKTLQKDLICFIRPSMEQGV